MKKKTYLIITVVVTIVIVISFLVYKFLNRPIPLEVVEARPKNGSINVVLDTEIVLTLNRVMLANEGDNLKIQISPEKDVETVYLENKIRISPKGYFETDTKYQIEVSYNQKSIYTQSFTTQPYTQEEMVEQGDKQTEADYVFNEAYKNFLNEMPWYSKIPIESAEYRIVYDFEVKSFRIRLKIKPGDDTQLEKIIDEALIDLRKIGVVDPIDYYILDTEGYKL